VSSRPEPATRLAAIERDIAKAKALITQQEVVTARLVAGGRDADPSRTLLETLREELVELYRTRRQLLQEIAGDHDQVTPNGPATLPQDHYRSTGARS
jgi:hypothetical protein